MKTCCECKAQKPTTEFHHSKSHGGSAPRCIPCAIKKATEWYLANKDKKRAYDAKRRKEKRHLYRAASRRFQKNNPGKSNAHTQARRAALANRIPPWAKPGECIAFYESAAQVTRCLGVLHVVDHIVPLRGKQISGLHVPLNLRVIPEKVNLLKGNSYSLEHEGRA